MSNSLPVFKVGLRDSPLSQTQTRRSLDRLGELLPGFQYELVPASSPGDRDRETDLRESPADFFTRDLDEAVLSGKVDCAVHSAKDVPDPVADGLEWCWLPWPEDRRDALVLRPGETPDALPKDAVIGVSSDRREAYAKTRFPGGRLAPVRGNIESRLAQLDEGRFDVLIMAGAALNRLGLDERVTEWIPLAELPTPDGQGYLALTFRKDDERWLRIRSLLVHAVSFVGAGVARGDFCTIAGVARLRRADVCLHDSLLGADLLEHAPATCEIIDVGKRCGRHTRQQSETTALILDRARRGQRLVRLKGGDPTLFGRLAEEVDALEAHALPYNVWPGVSSLSVAQADTGMLLTRRGVSRGVCIMTPREASGGLGNVDVATRGTLPLVFFMATKVCGTIAQQLRDDGMPPDTPVVVLYGSGTQRARTVEGTLADIGARLETVETDLPGLVFVGDVTRYRFSRDRGALQGQRVLLTCSHALQERAAARVYDLGGTPITCPLVRTVPDVSGAAPYLTALDAYDWLVVTSPSAVRCLFELLTELAVDYRTLPHLVACGPGTSRALTAGGLVPALTPSSAFGAEGTVTVMRENLAPGARVIRVRSDMAGEALANRLRELGADVDDCVLYRTEAMRYEEQPEYDAVFFASSSAVVSYDTNWGIADLAGKTVGAIGEPTRAALEKLGVRVDCVGREATVDGGLEALAVHAVRNKLENET